MDMYIAVCCGLISIFVVIFIFKKFGLCLEIEIFLPMCFLIFYPGFINVYSHYKLSREGCLLVVLFTLVTIASVFCAHWFYNKMPRNLTLQANNLTINKNKFFWTIIGLFYFYAIIIFLSYRHYQSDYIPFLNNHKFVTENIKDSWCILFIHPCIVRICANFALFIMFFYELNKNNVQKFFLLEKHNLLLFVVWVALYGLSATNSKSIIGYIGITWVLFFASVSKKSMSTLKMVAFCIFFVILSMVLKSKQINYGWKRHLQRIYVTNIHTVPFLCENFHHKYCENVSCSFWDYLGARLKNDKTKKSNTNVINGFALLTSDQDAYKMQTGFHYSLQAFLFLNYGLYSIFYYFIISFLLTLISRFSGKFSIFLFLVTCDILTPMKIFFLLINIVVCVCVYFFLKRIKVLVNMCSK